MEPAIDIQNLTKFYSQSAAPALDDLCLTVKSGEIFGFLGPNGAGKTTTIRLLLDFIRPDSGSVQVLGMDSHSESLMIRERIGYLPGELRLWDHMTGRDILGYLGGLRRGADLRYARELAERLHLDLDRRAYNYSTGNKRKVGIIQAMMHRPALLILDEPTSGLDPLVRQTFHDILNEAQQNGQTVFLSSHNLSEVEEVCDRVAILRAGRLRREMGIGELQGNIGRTVTIFTPPPIQQDGWAQVAGVRQVTLAADYVQLYVVGSLDGVVKHAANIQVDDMRIDSASLEQVFMEQYDD